MCIRDRNGIVAVVDVLHPDHRLGSPGTRIVARPFAKGAFRLTLAWKRLSLKNYFRVRGNGKSCVFSRDDLHRFPPESPRIIIFAQTVRYFIPGCQEQQRIRAYHDNNRTGFAAIEILLAVEGTVFAWRDIECDRLLIVHHYTIGAKVDPSFVGVPGHNHAGCSDVPSSVQLMHQGNGEIKKIHVITPYYILQYGTRINLLRRYRAEILYASTVSLDQIQTGLCSLQP